METKIKLELEPHEVYQLQLCVSCRMAETSIKWANSYNEEEQKQSSDMLNALQALNVKINEQVRNQHE